MLRSLRLTFITLTGPSFRSVSGGPGSDKYVLTQERARSGRLSTIVVSGSPSQGFTFSHSRERKQGFEHNPNEAKHGFLWSIGRHGMRVLQGTLMPAGYPSSVNPGFAAYAGWQGVTNLAVTTNMVMASTFLLYSVGLSAGTAIPTAGALNWVLKDGLGQLGTLVLGKTVAHNFDVHSKSWFFISTAMLTAAIGLEISTIILPQHFLILGSLAGMIKGLAFMASSSTRSVFNLSFVRDNNIADLTAKGTSQYICASLFGTLIGSTLCSWVGQDTYTAGACFLALSAVTLYGAFATVKTIPLPTLNSTRLQLLTESFLSASAAASRHQRRHSRTATTYGAPQRSDSLTHHHTAQDAGLDYHDYDTGPELEPMWAGDPLVGSATESENLYDEYLDPRVPSPAQLAAEDPPLPFLMGDQRLLNPAILVGESLERVLEDVGPELVVLLLTTYRLSHAIVLPRGPAVHVLLHQQATPRDICQGYLQACLLRRRMRAGSTVGLAAAQHAIEVQAAARAQQERQAAAAAAAEAAAEAAAAAAASAGDGSHTALQAHPHQPQGYDDAMADSEELCVVRGSASPALADLRIILQDTLQTAERLVTPFMRSMEAAGWRLEKVVVEAEKRRAHW